MTLQIDKDAALSLYGDGLSLKEMEAELGVSYSTIRNRLIRWIDESHLSHDRVAVLRLYKKGLPIQIISGQIKIPPWMVRAHLHHGGVAFRKIRHRVNDEFFSTQTATSCYWAGFLAADGWIEDDATIGVELHTKDNGHLQKFASAIGFTGKVKFRNERPMYHVRFKSRQAAWDLRRMFGIVPRKSKTLAPPQKLDSHLAAHFIRGYVDGDGSFCHTGPMFSVRGTKAILEWIKYKLQSACGTIGDPKLLFDGCWKLQFVGKEQVKSIAQWLYGGSTDSIRLNRKFAIATQWIGERQWQVKD